MTKKFKRTYGKEKKQRRDARLAKSYVAPTYPEWMEDKEDVRAENPDARTTYTN